MENDSTHSMMDTITQVSVLSALLARQFDGHFPCGELLEYGDFGIGTFDRMEGEMIIVDGNIYQGKADGKVYTPDLDNRVPFATVCHFRPDVTWTVSETVHREAMEKIFDEKAPNRNVFCAIRVQGTFSHVETHALKIQSKPYPSTAEVVKSVVHSEMHNVSGTIVGFRCPPFVRGINDPGYHLHFLSDDKTQGGHLLSFVMEQGECAIDFCGNHHIILPENGAALDGVDLSRDLVTEFHAELAALNKESSEQDENIEALIAEALASLDPGSNSFRIEAQGSRWEPVQGLRPGGHPLHPSDFDIVAVHDPSNNRMRLSWQRFVWEPLHATVPYVEIVVDNEGYIDGGDVALGPQASRPMKSDRLAAVRRLQQLLNPHLLVGDALRQQRETGEQAIQYVDRQELDGVHHHVVEIDALPRPIRLFLNLDTNHISRLVTQEHDFPCGDVEIAVTFSDWRDHDGFAFPYLIELIWEGVVIHSETRRSVDINPQMDPDAYVLPETEPFDPEAYERGLFSEQWIHRSLAMSAPFPLGAGKVAITSISPTIITIAGGIHHSLAIALDSEVVVVDPPLHEDRSLDVIEAVTAAFPDKPITKLILTHHHHDHSGGIRAYAAIGAELIVAEGDRDFVVQRCFNQPHTIRPDSFSSMGTQPTIRTVNDNKLSLGDGEIEVHRISSPHCAENLVIYVASAKLLFNADLFNPGLVRPGTTPPPDWTFFSREFRYQVEALNLDIELLVGAHGVPQGGPYQELIDFTE